MLATSYEGFMQAYLVFIALITAPGLGAVIYSLKKKRRSIVFLFGSLVTFGVGVWLASEAFLYRQHHDGMLLVYFVSPFVPLVSGLLGVVFCLGQKK